MEMTSHDIQEFSKDLCDRLRVRFEELSVAVNTFGKDELARKDAALAEMKKSLQHVSGVLSKLTLLPCKGALCPALTK